MIGTATNSIDTLMLLKSEEPSIEDTRGIVQTYYPDLGWNYFWRERDGFENFKPYSNNDVNFTDLISNTNRQKYGYIHLVEGKRPSGDFDLSNPEEGDIFMHMTVVTDIDSHYNRCALEHEKYDPNPYVEIDIVLDSDGDFKIIKTFESMYTKFHIPDEKQQK